MNPYAGFLPDCSPTPGSPKSRIAQALTEAGKPPSAKALHLKKAELATLAESEIKGTGWLPEPVRISEVTIDKPLSHAEPSADD